MNIIRPQISRIFDKSALPVYANTLCSMQSKIHSFQNHIRLFTSSPFFKMPERLPVEPLVPRPSPPPSMHAKARIDYFDYKDTTPYHFDTYHLVHQLERKGFAKENAEAVMYALSLIVNENVNNITISSVTRSQFEKAMYVNKVDFAHASNEMQLLERNDFNNVKSDVVKLNSELERYQNKRSEALRRVQSQVRLELTLEKARARDELSKQELKIKETESKIDTEFSNLRSTMETIYWDLFKSIFPLFCAAGALFFSYLRMSR